MNVNPDIIATKLKTRLPAPFPVKKNVFVINNKL